jgi:hypothetical protein
MRSATPLKPLARMSSEQLAAIVDDGQRRPDDSAEYLRAKAAQQELDERKRAAPLGLRPRPRDPCEG